MIVNNVTPYSTSFLSRQKISQVAQKTSSKISRNVVNIQESSLKGITKTPMRAFEMNDDAMKVGAGIALLLTTSGTATCSEETIGANQRVTLAMAGAGAGRLISKD